LEVAPSLVLFWIKEAHEKLKDLIKRRLDNKRKLDVIELDEIYTYVKKKLHRVLVWTAYSRRQKLTSQARQSKQ
jgi:hypothetical protein